MGLFDKHLSEIETYLAQKRQEGKVSEFTDQVRPNWPESINRNLVLSQDTAVELGSPKDASTSFLLWRNRLDRMDNSRIIVVGPDLPQIKETHVSFGKIVVVEGEDFHQENSYERYHLLEQMRYDIHLEGYMMRGVSQFQREWSRVSKTAIRNGFSFRNLGAALLHKFLGIDFVRSVTVIFITAGRSDVMEMKTVADSVMQIIGAMNKMAQELSFDCDACEYSDFCSDVADLRSMRKKQTGKEAANA
ncbi:MAG: hypothetical protein HY881_02835 [Deltaproteobacteria bacterium]|nr:hypothetical protein [Deltaproteobacteria bacterium]